MLCSARQQGGRCPLTWWPRANDNICWSKKTHRPTWPATFCAPPASTSSQTRSSALWLSYLQVYNAQRRTCSFRFCQKKLRGLPERQTVVMLYLVAYPQWKKALGETQTRCSLAVVTRNQKFSPRWRRTAKI